MLKEFEIDISELEKLKGISIGVTADNERFLIFTYKENITERAFPWGLWSVVAVLCCVCGLLIWQWAR